MGSRRPLVNHLPVYSGVLHKEEDRPVCRQCLYHVHTIFHFRRSLLYTVEAQNVLTDMCNVIRIVFYFEPSYISNL